MSKKRSYRGSKKLERLFKKKPKRDIEQEAVETLLIEDYDFHQNDFSALMLYPKNLKTMIQNPNKLARRDPHTRTTGHSPSRNAQIVKSGSLDNMVEPLMKFGIELDHNIKTFLDRTGGRVRLDTGNGSYDSSRNKGRSKVGKKRRTATSLGRKEKKRRMDVTRLIGGGGKRFFCIKKNKFGYEKPPRIGSSGVRTVNIKLDDKENAEKVVVMNEKFKDGEEDFQEKKIKIKKLKRATRNVSSNSKKRSVRRGRFMAMNMDRAKLEKFEKLKFYNGDLTNLFGATAAARRSMSKKKIVRDSMGKKKSMDSGKVKFRCISARQPPNIDGGVERTNSTIRIGKKFINIKQIMKKKSENFGKKKFNLQQILDDNRQGGTGDDQDRIIRSFWKEGMQEEFKKSGKKKGKIGKKLRLGAIKRFKTLRSGRGGETGPKRRAELASDKKSENIKIFLSSLNQSQDFVNSKAGAYTAFKCPKLWRKIKKIS